MPAQGRTRTAPFSSPKSLDICVRTFSLALSLTLGPSVIRHVYSGLTNPQTLRVSSRTIISAIKRETAVDAFAFAVTVAVGGGAYFHELLNTRISNEKPGVRLRTRDHAHDRPVAAFGRSSFLRFPDNVVSFFKRLSPTKRSFFLNFLSCWLGFTILRSGYLRRRARRLLCTYPHISVDAKPSPTLDFTLLLLVRALDAFIQSLASSCCGVASRAIIDDEAEYARRLQRRRSIMSKSDAFVFWASSARIMWCWFYKPERLPKSYVRWIGVLANVDGRLLRALQLLREGAWTYSRGSMSDRNLLMSYAEDMGLPAAWGDPVVLPSHGSPDSDAIYETLGVRGRDGLGGLPCELAHGRTGSSHPFLHGSCTANAGIRGSQAFIEALAIYLPAHLLSTLLKGPSACLRFKSLLKLLLPAMRSAAFLSTFITVFWSAVCFTRTGVLARLFPSVSHDFWDGPYGCIMAGCLLCGSSIWVEHGRRRGEIALYVLPRAIRTCIPDSWLTSSNIGVEMAERLVFSTSFAFLLTVSRLNPQALRGLSRWTLAFVMKGTRARGEVTRRDLVDPQPSERTATTYE